MCSTCCIAFSCDDDFDDSIRFPIPRPPLILSSSPQEEWSPHTNWLPQPPYIAKRITQWNYTTHKFFNHNGFTLFEFANASYARQRYLATGWGPVPPTPASAVHPGDADSVEGGEDAAIEVPAVPAAMVAGDGEGGVPAYHVMDEFEVRRTAPPQE